MPPPRFVVPSLPAAGESIRLARAEADHARSRRLSAGDPVVLIDGSGAEADGRIEGAGPSGLAVAVSAVRAAAESGPEIRLAVAGIRPERMSWAAEKAAELGVARLTLVRTERTQTFRAGRETLARLERLVREAAKQSGASRWPRCDGPAEFAAVLEDPAGIRLFLDASGDSFPVTLTGSAVALLVGPEGGWTESELAAAARAGWSAVALPAATLRAETAVLAAVVLTRAALARGGVRGA